jgi:hypothetical protein
LVDAYVDTFFEALTHYPPEKYEQQKILPRPQGSATLPIWNKDGQNYGAP